MNFEIDPDTLELREHRYGRFDKRMPVGPVKWPFHDLLWIHEGRALIEFPMVGGRLELTAPAGVLILPETDFSGRAVGAFATATICHFACSSSSRPEGFMGPGYMSPNAGEELHVQNLIRLALQLARRSREGDLDRRRRLLLTILDCFDLPDDRAETAPERDESRLAAAWETAQRHLDKIRTLSDVASLLGLQESALRTSHRKAWNTSAGKHLRELRLKRAEELLATTGYSLSEVATHVGYAHAETLSAAFKKSRGITPGQYRQWSNPFA